MPDEVPAETPAHLAFPKRPRCRTPTVLQMEAVECGAAALGIVLGYYGRVVPLETLRTECGVSRDGSKATNVLRAARNYGLVAKGFKKELEEFGTVRLPAILFWNFNHFLVVDGYDRKWVFLNDPETGPRKVTWAEFDRAFTGVVLVCEPGPEFKPGGRPPSMVSALRRRLAGSEDGLWFLIFITAALVLPGLVVPTFTKIFVDNVLIGAMHDWVRPLVLGMIVALLIQGGLVYLQQLCLQRMEIKLSIVNSGKFFMHVLKLPVTFFQQRFAGEIGGRVELNDRVAQLLSGQLATNAVGLFLMLFYAFVMFQYDVVLTFVSIAIAAANLVVLKVISRRRRDMNLRLMQEQGKLVGATMAGLQIIETLKAGGTETHFFARWSGYQAKALNAMQSMGVTTQLLSVVPMTLAAVNTAIILGVGGLRVIDGYLSIGSLVAYQALMASFIRPVNELVSLGGALQEIEGGLTRLDDVLNNPADERADVEVSAREKGRKMPVKLSGRLELRNVTFGYSPLEAPLIENFNLVLNPGERVAFVGPTGCGKSTISKLICGTYRPWSGEILFDGIPRDELPKHVITNSFAVVDQEIFLFEGPVRQNLTLWDATVPEQNILSACKDACIHEVIAARHNGYESLVLEGGRNFSGGQRQRLEIARALVNNPTVVLLDEATSALDPNTERQIDGNFRRRGCACVIIAHRLSTIRDCDQIVVLRDGKVEQAGTHDELVKQGGLYADLIKL
jgi:ATP-binding cassette, subfamily C, bacterial